MHAPEVLAALVQRLRRRRPAPEGPPEFSGLVHELPREDMVLAVDGHVLEIDRRRSAQEMANGVEVTAP